jgi:hypothetical protein
MRKNRTNTLQSEINHYRFLVSLSPEVEQYSTHLNNLLAEQAEKEKCDQKP